MSNINRDYLVIIDVKSGSMNKPSMVFYNTDKNTSNIYAQLVVKETIVHATPIENATDFAIELKVIKPGNIVKMMDGVLVNKEEAIYEFDLPEDFTNLSGNYYIEFWVKAKVNERDEMITSSKGVYTVNPSILTDLDEAIEDDNDYPLLLKLIEDVKVINETVHELDTTIRTLQSDMLETNETMAANEASRQAQEATRQADETTRVADEATRKSNEIVRQNSEATRETNEAARIANENTRKTQETTRVNAENTRIANETARVVAERDRANAEANRVSNENARVSAEQSRESAEILRETNEQTRKDNENARKQAEATRQAEHEEFMNTYNDRLSAIEVEQNAQSIRLDKEEAKNKKQDLDIKCLFDEIHSDRVTIDDEVGNVVYLQNSKDGFATIDELCGNTMVNCNKEADKELILNGSIDTEGVTALTLDAGVDGGLVDVSLEGNTMINVCDQKDPVAITADTNTFPLKYLYTSTKYIVQFESDTAVTIDITLGGTTLSSQNIIIGINKINIITPNKLTNNNLILNGIGFNASNIVVTKATDNEFGYFSGMKSVGECEGNEIEILSQNKNLFDVPNIIEEQMTFTGVSNSKLIAFAKVRKNTTYKVSGLYTKSISQSGNGGIYIGLFNNKPNSTDTWYITQNSTHVYTSESNEVSLDTTIQTGSHNYVGIYVGIASGSDYNHIATITNLQLEENSSKTDYIPHQSNKKQILLNEPLRAVGNVKDRFVLIDGKWYIERNWAEVVLDGSNDEGWNLYSSLKGDNSNTWAFSSKLNPYNYSVSDEYYRLYNDRLQTINPIYDYNKEMIYGGKYGLYNLWIHLFSETFGATKTSSSSEGLSLFKQYLQKNPIKIVGKLSTPTYEPIDYSPFEVYTDVTHISNNSNIPANMVVKNTGFNCILKPSTQYTVISNLGRVTTTTPSTLTEDCLRFYDTDTSDVTTMKNVMVLEGDYTSANTPTPAHFAGIESAFEQEYDETLGKYRVNVKVVGKNECSLPQTYTREMIYSGSSESYKVSCVRLKPNTDYSFNCTFAKSNNETGHGGIYIGLFNEKPNDTDLWYVTKGDKYICSYEGDVNISTTFNSQNYKYFAIYIGIATDSSHNFIATITNAQLENGTVATDYEAYKENNITFYLDEPLRGIGDVRDKVYAKEDMVVVERNCGQRAYEEGDLDNYLTDMTNTVYPLAQPTYEEVDYSDLELSIEIFKNSTLFYDSNIPVMSTINYTYSVPLVDEVSAQADISDEQDAMIVDLATQVAIMQMIM